MVAAPLTDLLKKDAFQWSQRAHDAFVTLKSALTEAPVLALPNFAKPFVLETDASGTGIGAVLSQDNHPIAYFSKKISMRMQKQSAYAREMYVITEAVSKFRHYLLGHKFIIKTDHKSLKEMQGQVIQTPEQQAWLPKLLGFDFVIEYKKGTENQAADALSRSFMAISEPQFGILNDLQQQLVNFDPKSELSITPDNMHHLQHKHGLWFWKDKILVPSTSDIKQRILIEFHDSSVGGHAGV